MYRYCGVICFLKTDSGLRGRTDIASKTLLSTDFEIQILLFVLVQVALRDSERFTDKLA